MKVEETIPVVLFNNKPVNMNVVFSWTPFVPDVVTMDAGNTSWKFDFEMTQFGGDFGGDIAILVDGVDTLILLDSPVGRAVMQFDTFQIRRFINKCLAFDVDVPRQRAYNTDCFLADVFMEL